MLCCTVTQRADDLGPPNVVGGAAYRRQVFFIPGVNIKLVAAIRALRSIGRGDSFQSFASLHSNVGYRDFGRLYFHAAKVRFVIASLFAQSDSLISVRRLPLNELREIAPKPLFS